MPELPEMQALAERLAGVMVGQRFAGAKPISFAGLKTYAPTPESLVGNEIPDLHLATQFLTWAKNQPAMPRS